MDKKLFNKEFFTYNEEATKLSQKISNIIEPIFKQYVTDGYSPIEIYKLMVDEIGLICSETIILNAIKKRKKMKIKPTEIVVMNMKSEEYWNNEIGWVEDLKDATIFSEGEAEVYKLPIEGTWYIIK